MPDFKESKGYKQKPIDFGNKIKEAEYAGSNKAARKFKKAQKAMESGNTNKAEKKTVKGNKALFKKKVKNLKKANKTQPGQDLKKVGPSSYQNVNNNVVYSDPKGVVQTDKDGNVKDYDYKQRKGKIRKIK